MTHKKMCNRHRYLVRCAVSIIIESSYNKIDLIVFIVYPPKKHVFGEPHKKTHAVAECKYDGLSYKYKMELTCSQVTIQLRPQM